MAIIEKIENFTLPVVPLRGVVAFPGVTLNFECKDSLGSAAVTAAAATDSFVILLTQKNPTAAEEDKEAFYSVGVLAKIRQTVKNSDGGTRVIAEGLCRCQILNMRGFADYIMADVLCKTINSTENVSTKGQAYVREAITLMETLTEFLPAPASELKLKAQSIKNPGMLADFIAANMLVRFEDKQQVLDVFEPMKRMRTLLNLMESEIDVLECEKEIHQTVRARLNRNQKEYYLREQIKVIQEELGGEGTEADEYFDKIMAAKLPKEVEEKLLKENERMAKMPFGSAESGVIRTYLDTCLELPWTKSTKDRVNVAAAQKRLDSDHYGLEKVKQRIVEYLAVLKLTGKVGGSILCLYGPPGVGKTSIAKSVARALGRKFVRMSLGGVKDEAEIRGHRKTYVGAIPGRIIYAMKEAGTVNPVILLDEIDKLSSDLRGDPASALLEVLDPEQNVTFRDRYLEIPYDLSKVLFITTANSLSTIPGPLLDRMEIIELNGYTRNEKYEIAKRYLIDKSTSKNGLTADKIDFKENAIYRLIDGYTREAGVRTLEREIGSVCRKVATLYAEGKRKRKYVVGENEVAELLGGERYSYTDELREDEVGACTGLAWTSVGGTTLTIEVALFKGKGEIYLTGKLGDVMKESAKIAHSYVKLNAEKLGIDLDKFTSYDVHIHIPEGATPKDGPSAGITMVTAIASAFTDKKVRGDVAMTGEVTLRGKVLPIGGLKEKSLAAYRLGIKTIIIPKKNVKDLEEIPNNIRKEMKFIPVESVDEVLKTALR